MKPRIIVCSLGRTGYRIFCLLRQQGAAVVGISDGPIPNEDKSIVVGNPQSTATLIAAGLPTAHTLVLAGSTDAQNLAILMQARLLNPRIRVINRLFNSSLGDRLDRTLPDHVSLSVSALAAPVFTFAALGNRAIGQLHLFDRTWPIREELIHLRHPWHGRHLSELWDDRGTMLIDYLPATASLPVGEPSSEVNNANLVAAVQQGRTLQAGDRLIVATRPSVRTTRNTWRKRFRRFFAGLGSLQRHGRPGLAAMLALFGSIALAVLVYISANHNIAIDDAIYFSVGMITGAGGKEEVAEQSSTAVKIFTALMMLIGAGTIGVFYALLNDYVLGTRLQQFWDVASFPQQNHYIVCGLGGIGIKIVQELQANGYEVIVIESDPHNRFLKSLKNLKIPVVIADAVLPSTLSSVHADRAEALMAVTSTDMTNLEIGLTARSIAPHLPVVVRNQDPRSALMVQEVFGFESVLSPVELAAPAFAAAALGGHILGNGITADRLWVALGTTITSLHPFCGMSVGDAAQSGNFVPLYLETQGRTTHGWGLLHAHLAVGDMLYLSIPAKNLDRLLRIAPDRLMDYSKGKHF